SWDYGGQKNEFNDDYPGYAIFISNDNADRVGSLQFGRYNRDETGSPVMVKGPARSCTRCWPLVRAGHWVAAPAPLASRQASILSNGSQRYYCLLRRHWPTSAATIIVSIAM